MHVLAGINLFFLLSAVYQVFFEDVKGPAVLICILVNGWAVISYLRHNPITSEEDKKNEQK